MSGWIITLIVIGSIFGLYIYACILMNGIVWCQKNNALGIILLFIALNIFGIIIGLCILYNVRQTHNNKANEKSLRNV